MNTWEIQAERKRNEREPRDWDTYRQALIESGMVAEAHERRLEEQRQRNGGMTDEELDAYYKQGASANILGASMVQANNSYGGGLGYPFGHGGGEWPPYL
jgi:hypothetical protein